MDDLKRYEAFQRAVFEGAEEAARLDAMPEPQFVPSDRCPRHPGQLIAVKGFSTLCPECEHECDLAFQSDDAFTALFGEGRPVEVETFTFQPRPEDDGGAAAYDRSLAAADDEIEF